MTSEAYATLTDLIENDSRGSREPDREDLFEWFIPRDPLDRDKIRDLERHGGQDGLVDSGVDEEATREAINSVKPVRIHFRKPPRERFIVLDQWLGVVEEIGDDFFVARLRNVDTSVPDEEAEFDIEEISPVDRHLLQPGSEFYWSVGYRDSLGGQRVRSSLIRFRRLPRWQPNEIQEAQRAAGVLVEKFGWA